MAVNIPKIGMRNFKTAISVFLCIIVAKLFNRGDFFYAIIASIMCMQSTIKNTKKVGMDRMIGTIIGGLLGFIFLYIDFIFLSGRYNFILIPVGIIIDIYICNLLNKGSSSPISCIVMTSIIFYNGGWDEVYLYTFDRIVETGVGIVIAMLVNIYLRNPSKKTSNIDNDRLKIN
ncbi:MAG: FUSC family protein [Oscillospiraceae bacterium]|nr:FUSC family protein [Oscillospiraceae bacterium]